MKVAVSAGGKFHSLHLAKQLQRKHADFTLYTNLFEVPTEFSNNKAIVNLNKYMLPLTALQYLASSPSKLKRHVTAFSDDFFDKLVASRIPNDIEIFHGFTVYSLYTIEKLKRSKKRPKILVDRGSAHVTEYNSIIEREHNKFNLPFYWPHISSIRKQIHEYKETDFILSPSTYVSESLVRYGVPKEKIIKIPYGAPIPTTTTPKPDKFRVIFIGGEGIAKGLHYLFEAFSELNERHSELLVVGKVEQNFPVDIPDNTKFIRKLPHSELNNVFQRCSVLALPSLSDGWGMVVTEAMAAGLPVIVSENTGAKDVVTNGKNGFIVPPCTVKPIKSALRYLFDNPSECKKMGKNAKNAVSKYTWNNYGNKISKIYKELV